jgi:hypothetical protein
MSRKVMSFKQMAEAYGVNHRTFRNDMRNHEGLVELLEAAQFDGRKFYPIHQQIIEEYFGRIPENNKH